jgi:hypothetical protein
MFGPIPLQRPPPQRGDTQRRPGQPAEEAAEDKRLNPQKITHWIK